MRSLSLMFLSLLSLSHNSYADVLTTQQLLEQKSQWKDWASEGSVLQITGRYRGTSGTTLQLQKLKLNLVPERGLLIPERIRTGDRLSIFGRFALDGQKIEFRMSRCDVRKSDQDEFLQELSKVNSANAAERYLIINRYLNVAEFFGDRQLKLQALRRRQLTLSQQRRDAQDDPDVLWTLIGPGPGFDIGRKLKQELLFQVCWLKAQRSDIAEALQLIRSHLPGWEKPNVTLPQSMLQEFEEAPVASYAKADDLRRRQLERLLYRSVKLREITSQLKSDNSNAQSVAQTILKELPEETDAARKMESVWADFRLNIVESMSRSQLEGLTSLLQKLARPDDLARAVDRWLQQQVTRFKGSGLEGQVRIAEEHLYAWDRWKQQKHQDQGVEYLKRGWSLAVKESPADAREIEQRLANFGWTRLHNRWLTDREVKQLPASDLELATREGRVVRGMSPAQVRGIHGVPTRRIRMASSQYVEELWVFGQRRTSRLAVHLRRPKGADEDAATVIEIFQQIGN